MPGQMNNPPDWFGGITPGYDVVVTETISDLDGPRLTAGPQESARLSNRRFGNEAEAYEAVMPSRQANSIGRNIVMLLLI